MDLGLAGRLAVVTGADSGIGWHTAAALLAEGARVVITDRDQRRLDDAAAALSATAPPNDAPAGAEVLAVAADITTPVEVADLRRRVLAELGPPEILVHAAGITGAQGMFDEIDDEGWRSTFEVDFFGAVSMVRTFLPDLRAAASGRLVMLASEDGVQPYPDELPYCAAKAAILNLVKGLSKSYGAEGLLVNAVSPAFIASPMTDAMMDKRADERGTDRAEAIESFLREERPGIEVHRRGEPEEVAAVITFLCSQQASFVSGSNYRVDSGSVATI